MHFQQFILNTFSVFEINILPLFSMFHIRMCTCTQLIVDILFFYIMTVEFKRILLFNNYINL